MTFEVEEAGCASCAERVRSALEGVVAVETVEIDEAHDTATVAVRGGADPDVVADALARASAGSGHAYRIRDGSWRAAGG